MGDFPKTLIMNILLASGFVYAGVAHLLRSMQQQPLGLLAAIVALYAMLALINATTAYALSPHSRNTLLRTMLRANWMLMALWGLCFAGILMSVALIAMTNKQIGGALSAVLPSALLTVLPQLLNIRALRSALASKNSALSPQPESVKPEGPVNAAGP